MTKFSKLNLVFICSALMIISFSCKKDDLSNDENSVLEARKRNTSITNTTVIGTTTTTSGLLYDNTFESTQSFPVNPLAIVNTLYNESSRTGAIALSSVAKRSGSYAIRFEVTKADAAKYSTAGSDAYLYERAELTGFKDSAETEKWYGFSHLMPSDFVSDTNWDLIFQMKQRPDNATESHRNPSISMLIRNDHYWMAVRYSADAINTTAPLKLFDLGVVGKDVWTDWVFHMKLSYGTDGLLEVWKNKQKVLSYAGPNSYNDRRLPFFSHGLYKFDWETAEGRAASSEDKRVYYFDALRIGNRNSSLEEVSPR